MLNYDQVMFIRIEIFFASILKWQQFLQIKPLEE
jgi:hypothetical protein